MRKGIVHLSEKVIHERDDSEQIQRLFQEELKFRENAIGILGNQLLQVLNREETEKDEKESKK